MREVTRAPCSAGGSKTLDLLLKDHIESLKLGPVCQSLRYTQMPEKPSK